MQRREDTHDICLHGNIIHNKDQGLEKFHNFGTMTETAEGEFEGVLEHMQLVQASLHVVLISALKAAKNKQLSYNCLL